MMDFLYCSGLLLMIAFSVSSTVTTSTTLVTTYPTSCKEIKTQLPASLSGLYDIAIDNTVVTVYCEMAKEGGGFTFIPRTAVEPGKLPSLINQLFTDNTKILLRIQKTNGLQTFTLLKQLTAQAATPLTVLRNTHTGTTTPLNAIVGEYLFLGFSSNTNGFTSNGNAVTYNLCGQYPTNSYFAFFPNHRELVTHTYHNNNLVYEAQGVAVDWRKTGVPSYGHRQMPNDFFFLTEMHFGGCGCYTSSDRWTDAHGTAIGFY